MKARSPETPSDNLTIKQAREIELGGDIATLNGLSEVTVKQAARPPAVAKASRPALLEKLGGREELSMFGS